MPSYQVGFWYQYKMSNRPSPATNRLVRQEPCAAGECFIVESEAGSTATYTAGLRLVEIRATGGASSRFTPPLQEFKWPLRVGDNWAEVVTMEDSSGRKQSAPMKTEVVSYESVTVPAGTFMAYKVAIAVGGRRFREAWYAPETKTVVRSVTLDQQGREVVSELTDYQRGQDAPNLSEGPARKHPE